MKSKYKYNLMEKKEIKPRPVESGKKRFIRKWIILIGMFTLPFVILAQKEVRDNKGNLQ